MIYHIMEMDRKVADVCLSDDRTQISLTKFVPDGIGQPFSGDSFDLSPDAVIMVSGSSKGTQPKYYEAGYWYKADAMGYEGKSEYLVAQLLSCSNVKEYVDYEERMINGKSGCRSRSFLKPEETFISYQRLHEIFTGEDLNAKVIPMSCPEERIRYVKEFVLGKTGLDISEYLSQILALDYLILNTDRHFNNLGLVVNRTLGEYRNAPIFDNGNALLSNWGLFHEETLEENIKKVTGQPFSSNLGYQAVAAGLGLKIDVKTLKQKLCNERESRALATLWYQLDHHPEFWMEHQAGYAAKQ